MPNPAKPVERKRKLGNPGKVKLPPVNFIDEQAQSIPDPLRPLGSAGRAEWDRIWTAGPAWISVKMDIAVVQILCEDVDERTQLRYNVLKDTDWHNRPALRALSSEIIALYSLLGFSPADRGKMGVGEVRQSSVLDELRLKREQRTGPMS